MTATEPDDRGTAGNSPLTPFPAVPQVPLKNRPKYDMIIAG